MEPSPTLNSKTADLFKECSQTFNNLAELVKLVHKEKALDSEKLMLTQAFSKFGTEIHRISGVVHNRSNLMMQKRMKKRIQKTCGVETECKTAVMLGNPQEINIAAATIQPTVMSFADFANSVSGPAEPESTNVEGEQDPTSNIANEQISMDDSFTSITDVEDFAIRNPTSIPPF